MSDYDFTGILLFSIFTLSIKCVHFQIKASEQENAYWSERRGRARVEREMRKLTEVQLNTSEGFFVQPIAYISSCYRQCIGTPRQGMLVPSSRARVILTTNMSPESLDGLNEFSHLWITFQFHLNTNTLKEAKAFKGTRADSKNYTFKAKITPPMLKEKKGVLATRSPHRPNPVGVTLARIVSVDKSTRTVHLCCCDLVDGTPVLDIKPYVPAYDTVPEYKVPVWIAETIGTRNRVEVSGEVRNKVVSIQSSLREYKEDADAFIQGIVETLEAEVRSKFQTERRMRDASRGLEVEVQYDNAIVRYLWIEERILRITDVSLYTPTNQLSHVQSEVEDSNNSNDNDDIDEGDDSGVI